MALKIMERTDQVLEIKKSPWGLRFFGLIFACAGLLVIFGAGGDQHLSCDRGVNTCELRKRSILGTDVSSFPARELTGARVQVSRSDDGETYRLAMEIAGELTPLTSHYSSGRSGKQRDADRINQFAQGRISHLQVKQNSWYFAIPFGGIFFLVGFFTIAMAGAGRIRISLPEDRLYIYDKNLLGKVKELTIPLSEIESVHLQRSTGSKGGTTYRVAFFTTLGEAIPLTSYYSSSGGGQATIVGAAKTMLEARKKERPEAKSVAGEELFPDLSSHFEESDSRFESSSAW